MQERYLFYLLPLALVAFCIQATHGWPLRRIQALLALGMLVLSVRVPLSAWTGPGTDDHAPFLLAVQRLELSHGVSVATGLVAALAGVFSVAAALGPWRPRLATPLLLALALAGSAAALAGATSFDRLNSNSLQTRPPLRLIQPPASPPLASLVAYADIAPPPRNAGFR